MSDDLFKLGCMIGFSHGVEGLSKSYIRDCPILKVARTQKSLVKYQKGYDTGYGMGVREVTKKLHKKLTSSIEIDI